MLMHHLWSQPPDDLFQQNSERMNNTFTTFNIHKFQGVCQDVAKAAKIRRQDYLLKMVCGSEIGQTFSC